MNTKTLEIEIEESRLEIIPEHSTTERRELKHSIQVEGQKIPIIVDQKGLVVDGRVRFEICQELGRECKYTIVEFANESDVIRYMLTVNLKRRHLNLFQKIQAYHHWYTISEKSGYGEGRKTQVIADEMHSDQNTIYKVFWLLGNADDTTLGQLANGNVAIKTAYNELKQPAQYKMSGLGSVTLRRMMDYFGMDSVETTQIKEYITRYREAQN